jgi:hypothetical protein
MDWTDDYLHIVRKLMAEQVMKGNRSNTHLDTLGYTGISNGIILEYNNFFIIRNPSSLIKWKRVRHQGGDLKDLTRAGRPLNGTSM